MAYNVLVYAMFGSGKIRWKRTTGKCGCSEVQPSETAYSVLGAPKAEPERSVPKGGRELRKSGPSIFGKNTSIFFTNSNWLFDNECITTTPICMRKFKVIHNVGTHWNC